MNYAKGFFMFSLAGVLLLFQAGCSQDEKNRDLPKENQSRELPAALDTIDTGAAGQTALKTVDVYYFHYSRRCYTCNMFEKYLKEVVDEDFADETGNGKVKLHVTNIEEKQNRHFAQDYKLFTKQIILSQKEDGNEVKWKNLEKIWDLVRDKEKFKEYIRREIKQSL
jgi:hypothetical protein